MRPKILKFKHEPTELDNVSVDNRMLNIGCGRTHHPDWVNLDLKSADPSVLVHDITKGIPFADASFQVVYHSHILEHLAPEQGEFLISECLRVLSPGGILRIVVPDLEQIAQLYLENHDRAWHGDPESRLNYRWMKLELLDQLVREYSGGQMGKYMSSQNIANKEFVASRIGEELTNCTLPPEPTRSKWWVRAGEKTLKMRERMARRCVRWLLGRDSEQAIEEGMFRRKGEIHRWMYDRFSLRELCAVKGFANFRVCSAGESEIPNWREFELDQVDGLVRKPDSLFVETFKPAVETRLPAPVRMAG